VSSSAIIVDIGALATAAGVGIGVWQLRANGRQAVAAFEDSLTAAYRMIAAELPVDVFLNTRLTAKELADHRGAFYRYFDLCNEQVFLRSTKRVSKRTWQQWRDGIRTNLNRHAFQTAWQELFAEQTDGDFDELRRLMGDYETDPARW
jgi:hypothetical protein